MTLDPNDNNIVSSNKTFILPVKKMTHDSTTSNDGNLTRDSTSSNDGDLTRDSTTNNDGDLTSEQVGIVQELFKVQQAVGMLL